MKSRVPTMLRIALFALVLVILPWALGLAAEPFHVGDTAPAFTLPFATRDSVNFDGLASSTFAGKRYVLAFYPADWSGGCTKEMCLFRDEFSGFEQLGVTVLPVSGDYVYSHHEWAKHHNLPFTLLSDPNRTLGKQLGVYRDDVGMFSRSVFVVGPDGKFEYIDYDYSLKDQADFDSLRAALKH